LQAHGGSAMRGVDEALAILLAHEPHVFPSAPDRIALTHVVGPQARRPGESSHSRRADALSPPPNSEVRFYGEYEQSDRLMIVLWRMCASFGRPRSS
jgi:hypothetical protein